MKNDKSCKTPRWRMLKSQLNNLSAKEFISVSNKFKDAIIIDVRRENEYKFGHLPNSINMDFFDENFLDKIEN